MKLGKILPLFISGQGAFESEINQDIEQSGALVEDISIYTDGRITLVQSQIEEFESSSADSQNFLLGADDFLGTGNSSEKSSPDSKPDKSRTNGVENRDENRARPDKQSETVGEGRIQSEKSKDEKPDKSSELPEVTFTEEGQSEKEEDHISLGGAPESQTETQNRIVRTRVIEEIRTYEEEEEKEETMIVAIAAGIGGFFILMILLVTACCISRRRRNSENVTTLPKRRTVEANPVEQTFERLDFSSASIGTTKRMKKAERMKEIEVTSSEIAPSSMGTLRTFVDRSTHAKTNPTGGNESDFRNTSSDIDSIESSNPPKSSKIITVISEKQKYELLATRDRSNYSSSSTSSSCDPKMTRNDRVINMEAAKPPPAYETITRSRDSVIDL